MGIEFLRDGQLQVRRHDAEQLLAIKRGEWTLEQVKAEAEQSFQKAEQAYLASTLPPGPDMDRINDLAVEVVQLAFEARNKKKWNTVFSGAVPWGMKFRF